MTRRPSRPAAAALCLGALIATALILASCSPRLGWGLVLWTAPEGPLPAGSIVPVYIKSNIQKLYVVGVPGLQGKDKNKKIELPLWQIDLFGSRGAAAARAKALGPNISLYMIAARDGLPLRDKPSNTLGKKVFRLREGQTVKVLDKVEGEQVSTGGEVLPGYWYLVLADDGTRGYIFSYALRLYDEAKEGPPVIASANQALSGRVDLIFSRSWRPEYFQEMLDDSRVDLDYFSLRYGLFVDAIRKQVRVELPAASEVFDYSDITETSGVYAFVGTPLRIKIETDKRLLVSWTGADASSQGNDAAASGGDGASAAAASTGLADSSALADAVAAQAAAAAASDSALEGYVSAGSAGSASFVVLTADALETVRLETLRRQKLLSAFVDGVGGAWRSPADNPGLGQLAIAKSGRFSWKGRGDAVAGLVAPDAGETGEVSFRLYLDPSIASSWSGSFSLRFDQAEGAKTKPAWLDFLYRRSPGGLVIAPAAQEPSSIVALAAAGGASLVFEPAPD
jgi:hypothetical protein